MSAIRPEEQKEEAISLAWEGCGPSDIGRKLRIPPNTVTRWLNKYGPSKGERKKIKAKKRGVAIDTFFKGKEKVQLNGLLKALEATKRAQEAAVTTPTGQQLIGAGTLAAAVTNLPATIGIGGTVGGLARLYESAPVRNALLRLGSIPKGSTQFEQAVAEAVAALTAGAQAVRE